MKLTVLSNNGYPEPDQLRIEAAYKQLVKQAGQDIELLDMVVAKVAVWRLPPEAVMAAMISLGTAELADEPKANKMAARIRRFWDWCQKLPAEPKHRTSTSNLINLLLSEAGDGPEMLIMLVVALCKVRSAGNATAKGLAVQGLQLWAPLANRLALGQLKDSIEDTCFKILYPEKGKHIQSLIDRTHKTRPKYLKSLKSELRTIVKNAGIKVVEVQGRIKHGYSVYRKIAKAGEVEKIHDLVALRLIVPTKDTCYKATVVIHDHWPELEANLRTRDYIAHPKPNGYQSIHTTVNANGEKIEIQIRTPAMHAAAEEGMAAHWRYDQLKSSSEYQKGELVAKSKPFKTNQLYVFSPKGDVFHLPPNATALDFAYEVHSSLGNHATAIKINAKIAKLNTPLKSGDLVEVVTQKNAKPHADWLRYVVTNKARNRIRAALAAQ